MEKFLTPEEKQIEKLQEQLAASQARERELREALQELVNLMEDVRCGDYKPDSFICQPAFEALSKPSDTSALDAAITAAKAEEREAIFVYAESIAHHGTAGEVSLFIRARETT